MVMGTDDKLVDVDVFDQIDEALEEREGADRRKQDKGPVESNEDRRKNDRRAAKKSAGKTA